MSRMTIVVNVEGSNPAIVDPHEIALDIVDTYNDEIRHGNAELAEAVEFVSAEWDS